MAGRRHGVVYELGHELGAGRFLRSKGAYEKMVVSFFQRRMNTSYSLTMYRDRHDRPVRLRERWYYNGTVESILELYREDDELGEVILGKSYPNGRVWLSSAALDQMRWRFRLRVSRHLEAYYDDLGEFNYARKTEGLPVQRRAVVVRAGDSFADIMNKEWSV
jgi:hypothetical protein